MDKQRWEPPVLSQITHAEHADGGLNPNQSEGGTWLTSA